MNARQISDARALQLITEQLSGADWGPDTVDYVAHVVGLTGRAIEDTAAAR